MRDVRSKSIQWWGWSLAALTLVPLRAHWTESPQDNFPLSHYPMFSAKRDSLYSVFHYVGLDREGRQHNLPYGLAGSGGFNQIRRQIRKTARSPQANLAARQVADRVARSAQLAHLDLVTVMLVRHRYRFHAYFPEADTAPVQERVYATVRIPRR